jgi:hypothetical protein
MHTVHSQNAITTNWWPVSDEEWENLNFPKNK